MPDRRRHRGRHPDDDRLFADAALPALRSAVADFSLLLSRGYAEASALKLVGDRFALTARQRLAVMRCACPDAAVADRRARLLRPEQCAGRDLSIDGYNVLITVESALSGGLILRGRDGCCRDLASLHSTYRRVEETDPALALIGAVVARLAPRSVTWYLDAPVSNSGRLKVQLLEIFEARAWTWDVQVVPNPDRVLVSLGGVVATSDSWILDQGVTWVNLAAHVIGTELPGVRALALGEEGGEARDL